MRSMVKLTGIPTILPATMTVCTVELATLAVALRNALGVAEIAALFASFHLGYLLADPLRRRVAVGTTELAAATVGVAVALCFLEEGLVVAVAAIVLLVFNAVAQAARRSFKDQSVVRSPAKNIYKGLGMALGGIIGWFQMGSLALVLFAAYFAIRGSPGSKLEGRPAPVSLTGRDRVLIWGEFFHHSHYFVYCYVFWYLAPMLISSMIGVWFLIGWVAYFATELLWRESRRVFAPMLVASGHLLVAVALLTMPHLDGLGVLLAWSLTGVGGGTAYMLGNAGGRGPRERFEDSGHVAGVGVAAIIALLSASNDDAVVACVLAGAVLALVTGIMFTMVSRPAGGDGSYKGR